MKKFKVKIKDTKRAETINAKTELEAKVKFCQERDLKYQFFFNKLEVKPANQK